MIKWLAIQPLIGGMAIGAQQALDSLPIEIISYSELPHEKHLLEYYKQKGHTVPYTIIKSNDDYKPIEEIDVVVSVPICSGLSMLNNATNGKKARGADAEQNDNMYNIADLALRIIKPKAFILENAPTLSTSTGQPVLKKLQNIGIINNYSMTVIKTSTLLHGIPQDRKRTFVIFWKSKFCPILSTYNKPQKTILEYLSEIPSTATLMNSFFRVDDIEQDASYMFMKYKVGEIFREEMIRTNSKTAAQYICNNNLLDEAISFLQKNDKIKDKNIFEKFKYKMSLGKGFWDNTIHYCGPNYVPAIIGKNMWRLVHPIENRFYSVRELMWFMGLPHDFNLVNDKQSIHLTQNVPVPTAADWILEIRKFVEGQLPLSNNNFIIHNNFKKIDITDDSWVF